MTEVPLEVNRARQLFRFLKAFAEQRMPKHRSVDQHSWSMYFRELPHHPSIAIGEVVLTADGGDQQAPGSVDPLLRVTRPRLTKAPRPPAAAQEYLLPGWEDPEGKVAVASSRNIQRGGRTTTEYFQDDAERVGAFEEWRRAWDAWAAAELPARRAMKVYERFYQLRGQIEAESERFELVLGDGRLRWNRPDGVIDHPLLLQRVELVFDTDANEFRLVDADRPPELYAPLLGGDAATPDRLHDLGVQLEKVGFHPLSREITSAYFRQIAAILGPRAEFVDARPGRPDGPDPVIGRDPVLFLRVRPPGFAGAFDRVLVDLESRTALPVGLTRVLGVEPSMRTEVQTTAPTPWSEPADVLLSKPANEQQIQIARVLERRRAVLVQGPPGTGKSHTIANLIGHLVAHGKRVLVTSHTTKALRVLRDQVVPTLQPLCVSALENDAEGRAQLEQAIRGILARLTVSTEELLSKEAGDLASRRVELIHEVEELATALRTARSSEYEAILVDGSSLQPAEAAAWVRDTTEAHGWIPAPVVATAPLPLSESELRELYATTGQITGEEEVELSAGVPDLGQLHDPEWFEGAARDVAVVEPSAFVSFWSRPPIEVDRDDLERLEADVRTLVTELDQFVPWQRALVAEGHSGGTGVQLWLDLARMVEEAEKTWDMARPILLEHVVEAVPAGELPPLRRTAESIVAHMEAGKAVGALTLAFRSSWKAFIQGSRVNGQPPSLRSHFKAIATHLWIEEGRGRLTLRWKRQAEPVGLPLIGTLPKDRLETTLLDYTRQFEQLLTWWPKHWRQVETRATTLGFRWSVFRATAVAADAPATPFERDVRLLRESLHVVISARAAAVRALHARRAFRDTAVLLSRFRGPVCRALCQAVEGRDPGQYRVSHSALADLSAKVPVYERRRTLLDRLAIAAPSWTDALKRRAPAHNSAVLPGHPRLAWRWIQLHQELERRRTLDHEALGARIQDLQARLRETTADLIDRRAWLGQLRRVDLAAQQALQGWAQLQRKIGRGTGKRAPRLQAEARKRLTGAQSAVPVWIMPLARVAEAVDPINGRFDVVIIDEASQCDVNGLLAWYLADQLVVVGDDKQVSPMAVGQRLDPVQDLIDTHLNGIPNRQLYDGTLSLYDLAQQAFGGTVRLREHFRCMPDIIEFSNELSYDFEIEPLRDPHAAPPPHVIEHVVGGASRDGKTNAVEAQVIAALIGALVEQPEYATKTLGVISLLGDEQAHLIWALTAAVVDPEALERRRFIAGNSAQFQGDERHVIFLSMVDAPVDGILPMRQEEYLKQRYNVAASRAKDQLWLVHSLDPSRHLRPGDLRRRLIEYVRNPGAKGRAAERAKARTESPFEVEVMKRLIARGYGVRPQVKVGSYRIDLVVSGSGGQVAIECDGARWHPPEKIPEDLARQAVLERCGWRFIRIRSTAFFSDPDAAVERVVTRLHSLGVEPDAFSGPEPTAAPDPLIEAVRRRAWEIMREVGWRNT